MMLSTSIGGGAGMCSSDIAISIGLVLCDKHVHSVRVRGKQALRCKDDKAMSNGTLAVMHTITQTSITLTQTGGIYTPLAITAAFAFLQKVNVM